MERIEVREIECFVAVAENLSFSRAARLLHMTQPPLSRQIQKLEGKLGVELFFRNNQGVEMTPEGQLFLQESIFLLRHIDRVSDAVRFAHSGRLSTLNVGFLGALLDDQIVGLLRQFREGMPDCRVNTHEVSLDTVADRLANREVDGVFVGSAEDVTGKDLGFLQWRIPKYKVLLAANHPLANRQELRLKDLIDENWMMLSRNSAPFFHRQFIDACVKQGFQPKIVAESDRLPAILAMVALGEGIGLLSHENMLVSIPRLVLKPLIGGIPKVKHSFVYRKSDRIPALEALKKLLTEKRTKPSQK
ncbi:LysR family transcriptional regulator [Luteolibacter pohnpeiensis]|uniref:LysR family transcriptional regulator n=1 Tax=Luteolibacter pohnpeiensis TaxID=454153 RepID=A0A934SBE0_9BACT|nr:LysR family transcriptional regulator [Luteolibacter pohnpeiensis]MBK1882804.1 LysR family transcriptional regulator [Luteolibacter pohnpeiensis]